MNTFQGSVSAKISSPKSKNDLFNLANTYKTHQCEFFLMYVDSLAYTLGFLLLHMHKSMGKPCWHGSYSVTQWCWLFKPFLLYSVSQRQRILITLPCPKSSIYFCSAEATVFYLGLVAIHSSHHVGLFTYGCSFTCYNLCILCIWFT